MGETFEQVADVHLIGFVVAGQSVHHKIDAAAEGELVLAASARGQCVKAFAVGVARPPGRQIVGCDDR